MTQAYLESLITRSTGSSWVLCVLAAIGIWRLYVLGRPKMRELDISEAAALRAVFVSEMGALREEISGLRQENSNLRREVRELHGVIDGMRRENLAAQISVQGAVMEGMPAGVVPPATRAALDRMKGTNE